MTTATKLTTVDPQAVVRYVSGGKKVSLSIRIVQELIQPLATDIEAAVFLELCTGQSLNPFLQEVFLIKYDKNRPAAMVIGKAAYLKRAEAHPQYNGFEAGIIVKPKEGVEYELEGEVVPEDHGLIGAWARVYRKDRSKPAVSRVSLKVYDKNQSVWADNPALMLRKTALVQALREMFPQTYGGVMSGVEVADEEVVNDFIDATAREVEAPPTEAVETEETTQDTSEPEQATQTASQSAAAMALHEKFYAQARSEFGTAQLDVDRWVRENLAVDVTEQETFDDLQAIYRSFKAAQPKGAKQAEFN
jgi:phage recombination protein Bet